MRTKDQTWELCIEMWEWIVARFNKTINVRYLKNQWLEVNGYDNISLGCFLCDWDNHSDERYNPNGGGCSTCPAVEIDNSFNCENINYVYDTKPIQFLAKIKELNAIRLKGKKK